MAKISLWKLNTQADSAVKIRDWLSRGNTGQATEADADLPVLSLVA